jgi:hypothetical protein
VTSCGPTLERSCADNLQLPHVNPKILNPKPLLTAGSDQRAGSPRYVSLMYVLLSFAAVVILLRLLYSYIYKFVIFHLGFGPPYPPPPPLPLLKFFLLSADVNDFHVQIRRGGGGGRIQSERPNRLHFTTTGKA